MRDAIGSRGRSAGGFSLVEVIISMFLTAIVMGAVYGLLLKGQQAFQREPDVVDVQQSARTALAMVSADVLQASTGLPPEFPAFTPKSVDGAVGDGGPDTSDVIEVVGNLQGPGEQQQLPEALGGPGFVGGTTVTLASKQTNLRDQTANPPDGDLVVVYNDSSTTTPPPIWWMGRVKAVDTSGTNAVVTVVPDKTAQAKYNKNVGDFATGFITKVSVVRYSATLQNSLGATRCTANQQTNQTNQTIVNPCVLYRSADFQAAMPVGTVYDFQVAYYVDADGNGVADPAVAAETMLDPVVPVEGPTLNTTVTYSVNVQVFARSLAQNEFIRKSFSTMVNPRNITSGLGVRTAGNTNGPAYQ